MNINATGSMWFQGMKFGNDWKELDFTYSDFSGFALFRDVKDGRAEIVSMFYANGAKAQDNIVTLFHEPKGYRIKDFSLLNGIEAGGAIDGVSKYHTISTNNYNPSTLTDTYRFGDDTIQCFSRFSGFNKGQWYVIHAYVPIEKI